MATYNGSRYVRQQLETILPQLSREDEVIVVDDCSSDETCEMIECFSDARIRLFRNETNLGVVPSFEIALHNSTGDIIFLSDQDDLWRPDKVSCFMHAFNDPRVTLVLSDANLIDADGNAGKLSYFQFRGGFVTGVAQNILSNHYIGCTMACRRQMLAYCLPFPKNLPMHDSWIGIVNESFGKTYYIDRPLMDYRRHGKNVSKRGNRIQQARWRLSLIGNIIKLRIRAALNHSPILF
ncbi:MAG TPA: glycosyltransferase family 2 protein [Acidobacteriaceae bacterium]|jgi:glycosyltransferase involved in cell wall biosynthesis|nr:glycosyltransferase family 2 protein [Acidobacteriaceae bacterium]